MTDWIDRKDANNEAITQNAQGCQGGIIQILDLHTLE